MQLVDFTSFDDIRAALGVASAELKDSTLSLGLYSNNLESEFAQIGSTLATDFSALPVEASRTDLQKTFARYVQLFATYVVAKQLTPSLPLFSPKEIGDGKATMTRYTLDPYKVTIQGVNAQYETYKALLITAFAGLTASAATALPTRPYFLGVPSSSDPVLGT